MERIHARGQLPHGIAEATLIKERRPQVIAAIPGRWRWRRGRLAAMGKRTARRAARDTRRRPNPHIADEVATLDQLHREEPPILDGEHLIQIDQVRMSDIAERTELLLEPNQGHRLDASHRLEGDEFPALLVIRLVDDAHPARAHAADQGEPHGVQHRPEALGLGLKMMVLIQCEGQVLEVAGLAHAGRPAGDARVAGRDRWRSRGGNLSSQSDRIDLGLVPPRFERDGLGGRLREHQGRRETHNRFVQPADGPAPFLTLAVDQRADELSPCGDVRERRQVDANRQRIAMCPTLMLIDQKNLDPLLGASVRMRGQEAEDIGGRRTDLPEAPNRPARRSSSCEPVLEFIAP